MLSLNDNITNKNNYNVYNNDSKNPDNNMINKKNTDFYEDNLKINIKNKF